MKIALHKLADGGVGVQRATDSSIALMTGSGLGWDEARTDWEVTKLMMPAPAANWDGFPEPIAREWATAVGQGGLTEAEALDLMARRAKARHGYTEHVMGEEADLPYHVTGNGDPLHGSCLDPDCHDRYFRAAVEYSATGPVKPDMAKARDIHMTSIRSVRDAELAKADVDFMRAIETGDAAAQSRITAKKQTLRDIPQTFSLGGYRTAETLKTAWPTELPRTEAAS
tara:strand:- start:3283 stop:3963 length:681 start_codon:yes stop_codon:yes gene_type:complete